MGLKVTSRRKTISTLDGVNKRLEEIDRAMDSLTEEKAALHKTLFYASTQFAEGQVVRHLSQGYGVLNYCATKYGNWWKFTPYKDGVLSDKGLLIYDDRDISSLTLDEAPVLLHSEVPSC